MLKCVKLIMKCCVQNCGKNDRDEKLNQTGYNRITFHSFPKDPQKRAAWVESLAIPNWMPTKRTVICSEHFEEKDFVTTKPGYRRLKRGVVPIINVGFYGPAALRICKLCLALDAKMYQLKDNNLDKMYQNIIGMVPRMDMNNRLPMGICWECTARLQSAASFRSKALMSDALLQAHLKSNTDLKVTDILNLHRKHTNLKSSLIVQDVFKFNSQYFEEHAPNAIIKPEALSIGIPHNDEPEIEVKNLIANTIIIKDEHRNEIFEETYLNNDYKTEVDLIPLTEIGETLYNLENDNDDVVTENVCVETNGRKQASNMHYNNYVTMVENKEEIVDDNRKRIIFNLLHDDHIDNNDNEGNTKHSNEADVRVEEMETTEVETKKGPVQNPKVKRDVDDKVLLWVRARKKQKYVKPCTPIDEKIFTITTLNHQNLIQEILERKDSERYKQALFKCTVCYRWFPTEDKLARHVFKHSEESGSIKCVICKIRLKSAWGMRAHMKQQHTAEFVCKLCPLVTRNRNVALGHMKFHAGSKYQCPRCTIEFEKKTTLLNHLRLKHMSDCVCELCGYTFISKHGVQAHKRKKHKFDDNDADLTGPYCEVCEVKFFTQKAYDRHLRLSSKHIKSEDDPNRLRNDPSIKSRRLARSLLKSVNPEIRRRRVNPMNVHNGPVTCEQCGVELGDVRTYARHFKHSHPGIKRTQFTLTTIPFMCEHCGKMFSNATYLAGHMSVHTGQRRFQCDHCHKTFSMKTNLVIHMQQHNSVRPSYECRVCGKQFSQTCNLTRHMFIHTGLKPFKCDACEKVFRTSGELRSHVDHVHLNKPRPKRVRRRVNKSDLPTIE